MTLSTLQLKASALKVTLLFPPTEYSVINTEFKLYCITLQYTQWFIGMTFKSGQCSCLLRTSNFRKLLRHPNSAPSPLIHSKAVDHRNSSAVYDTNWGLRRTNSDTGIVLNQCPGFVSWDTQQLSHAAGYTPSAKNKWIRPQRQTSTGTWLL